MLPPITPSQFPALSALAGGPFSYRYRRAAMLPNDGVPMTDYPAPDGGWEWKTCFAGEWTPELAGIPSVAWEDFWVAKTKIFSK